MSPGQRETQREREKETAFQVGDGQFPAYPLGCTSRRRCWGALGLHLYSRMLCCSWSLPLSRQEADFLQAVSWQSVHRAHAGHSLASWLPGGRLPSSSVLSCYSLRVSTLPQPGLWECSCPHPGCGQRSPGKS